MADKTAISAGAAFFSHITRSPSEPQHQHTPFLVRKPPLPVSCLYVTLSLAGCSFELKERVNLSFAIEPVSVLLFTQPTPETAVSETHD